MISSSQDIGLANIDRQDILPDCSLWIADIGNEPAACMTEKPLQEKRRLQSVLARQLLLHALAELSGISASLIQLTERKNNTPLISLPNASGNINASLSHSGKYVACVLSRSAIVGLDIELMKPRRHFLEIARLAFTPSEYKRLAEQVASERMKEFYRLWTRREAIFKLETNMPSRSDNMADVESDSTHKWFTEIKRNGCLMVSVCALFRN